MKTHTQIRGLSDKNPLDVSQKFYFEDFFLRKSSKIPRLMNKDVHSRIIYNRKIIYKTVLRNVA